jgi:uncharacterized protein
VIGVGADAVSHGAHHLVIERVEILLPRLPEAFDGFTIVQLSDFHYDPHFSGPVIQAAVAKTNALRPDLVVLTGDFVTEPVRRGRVQRRGAAANAEPCAALLAHLQPRLGSIAVLGNHDAVTDPDFIASTLLAHNIQVLRNAATPIQKDGSRLWLAGLDDVLRRRSDLRRALNGIPTHEFTILLVHEPDFADSVRGSSVDLQLSGHSHGGQICLPLIGPPYLPPLGKKYPWGLRRLDQLALYTNRGIGTIGVPARLNCPPEITLFTLRKAAQVSAS